jgi:hypothetical protein
MAEPREESAVENETKKMPGVGENQWSPVNRSTSK